MSRGLRSRRTIGPKLDILPPAVIHGTQTLGSPKSCIHFSIFLRSPSNARQTGARSAQYWHSTSIFSSRRRRSSSSAAIPARVWSLLESSSVVGSESAPCSSATSICNALAMARRLSIETRRPASTRCTVRGVVSLAAARSDCVQPRLVSKDRTFGPSVKHDCHDLPPMLVFYVFS
jgi:hypothetical protein